MKNKFQDFINEGLRINPEYFKKDLYYNKKYPINDVLNDMINLEHYISQYINEEYIINIINEINDVIKELIKWKEDGWKYVKFEKGEWYPEK